MSAPNGDSATGESATAACGSSVCPPPWTHAETDGQPCSGSKIQQGDSLSSTVALDAMEQGIDNATLVTIRAGASNPDTAFVDRVLVSGQDGRPANTVPRRSGTINLVELPSGLTSSAPDPLGSFTYLVTLGRNCSWSPGPIAGPTSASGGWPIARPSTRGKEPRSPPSTMPRSAPAGGRATGGPPHAQDAAQTVR